MLKEQMMTSVRKTLKHWSDQHKTNRFQAKFALKITQIRPFFTDCFLVKFAQKLPQNSREINRFFREFVPKNPAKFDFFFCGLSEALLLLIHGKLFEMGALSNCFVEPTMAYGTLICYRLTTIKKSIKQLLKNLQLQLLKNHENNPLPIKKTGKKTPAGMGKATDTAVMINCNRKTQ